MDGAPFSRGACDFNGHVHTGPEASDSLGSSHAVTSPDDELERDGRSLATASHDVIRESAVARDATPATVDGTEHDGHPGVLRFDFGGESDRLRRVEWEELTRSCGAVPRRSRRA